MLKFVALFAITTMTLGFVGHASGCRTKRNSATAKTETQMKDGPSELRVLAAGFHSSITHPFVAVIRDADTYSELTKLDGNLPKLDEEFFKSNVIVAAFLGERNTGGYSVEITREGNSVRIAEQKPGKGMMVPQMITSPFEIAALENNPASAVTFAADEIWAVKGYRVKSGNFTMSGGFAGFSERFGLSGVLGIKRENNLATIAFGLVGSDPSKKYSLNDVATGVVQGDGHFTISKMSAGSFVKPPNSGLKAMGEFTAGASKISLTFISLPSMIADGYIGQGNLEAEVIVIESIM